MYLISGIFLFQITYWWMKSISLRSVRNWGRGVASRSQTKNATSESQVNWILYFFNFTKKWIKSMDWMMNKKQNREEHPGGCPKSRICMKPLIIHNGRSNFCWHGNSWTSKMDSRGVLIFRSEYHLPARRHHAQCSLPQSSIHWPHSYSLQVTIDKFVCWQEKNVHLTILALTGT